MTRDTARSESIYDAEFYKGQQDGSLSSARTIIPLVLKRFEVKSIVDVGCGVGTWLSVALEHGVADIAGLDGDYVDRAMLKIPARQFIATDLRVGLPTTRTFDLALCLEVAEHLPADVGDALIGHLTSLAPVVVFSAAIPGQGGSDHINEQWQDYWRERFAAKSFQAVDFIRPQIRGNNTVDYWYQQNTICYCNAMAIEKHAIDDPVSNDISLDLVHPRVFLDQKMYFSKALAMLPTLAIQAVKRRLFRAD